MNIGSTLDLEKAESWTVRLEARVIAQAEEYCLFRAELEDLCNTNDEAYRKPVKDAARESQGGAQVVNLVRGEVVRFF